MFNKPVENIGVSVGDIISDNNGKFHRALVYCTNVETQDIMMVFETMKGKSTWAIPIKRLTSDKYFIAIEAEDLEGSHFKIQ